jgi:hypothetical protein
MKMVRDESLHLQAARRLGEALTAAGITWALGGSAVLIAHDLWHQPPGDFDLTTDADLSALEEALQDFAVTRSPKSGVAPFMTEALLVVEPAIDLIVKFAIRTETGTVYLPTIVTGTWQGLQVGAPEVWAVAYRLMDRPAKADLLSGYLLRRGADPAVKAMLLAQPLPLMVRDEVESWPEHGGENR